MLKTSYYICLLLLSLGQLTLLNRTDGSGTYVFDFSVGLFALLGTLYFLLVKRSLEFPKVFRLFIIFILVGVISLVFSLFKFTFADILPGAMYLVRFSFYLLSGVVLFNMVINKMTTSREIFYSIILSGVLISVAGFIQLYFLPDFTVLDASLGWDPHKNRLASTFFDPNFTGAYLGVCLVLLFDRYYIKKDFKFTELLLFIIILVAFFLTFSRSAWGMLAVVIFVFGYYRSRTLLYVSLLVAFCAFFAIPRVQTRISGATDPADSARLRIESWSNAYQIAKENLLVGVGFNNYKIAQQKEGLLDIDAATAHSASGTDSSLLLVLATTGILGLAAYLFALLFPAFEKKTINVTMLALVGGLLLNSLFINSLFYPQILFLLFSIHSFSRT